MVSGRLKIGSSFLKIGSSYLRIGPAPAAVKPMHFRGENAGGSPLTVSVANPLAADNRFLVFIIAVDSAGGGAEGTLAIDSPSFDDVDSVATWSGTSTLTGATWKATLFSVQGPAGGGDPFSLQVSASGTITSLLAGVFEVENSTGLSVLQSATGVVYDSGTLTLTLPGALSTGNSYVIQNEDFTDAVTPDADWTEALDQSNFDFSRGFYSTDQVQYDAVITSGGDIYAGVIFEL